ncbi:MAG: OprD family outer membrane porin, partial [Saprospiraceae bacterium]|nr:OprD family outer membrane porin [Saprospiraceae bacterium]
QSAASPKTASNLLEAFEHGHFHGHFRTFFMTTDNARNLSDYYAWAAGGGLHFSSAPWHGFNFGIGGVFHFNLASSDLGDKDSLTGVVNRYEIGLFDVSNPHNRDDLDRIEELWLRYQWKKSRITIGQQALQTPFINYQDGRMRPTAESGAWLELNDWKNTKLEAGWLWKMSPRSTVKWYGIGESIGLYPKGLNPDGTGSGYPENLDSKGIALLGVTRQFGKNTNVQIWDQYVEHIFNTAFAQVDYSQPLSNGDKLLAGLQYTHQDAVADGGNPDAALRYFQAGGQSNVISAQAGWQRGGWKALLAYTRITADGRFLAPREWGREPFYTFMPRERIEGSGNSQAVTGRVSWQAKNQKLRLEAAYGHFYLPDVTAPALNKYAFPAFRQLNLDVRYAFGGMLDGLKAQVLYVWKGRIGEVYGNDKLVINKVDMSHLNLVLNYTY